MHLEVLSKSGFAADPHGEKVVPGLDEGMEWTKEGVKEDPKAFKAVGDFGHEVGDANLSVSRRT